MGSLHRVRKSKYWHAAFTQSDGRRALRSTKKSKRSEALQVLHGYEEAARLGRERRLTEGQARRVIADIFYRANHEKLPTSTVEAFFTSWLKRKALEVSDSTYASYAQTCRLLAESLGAKAHGPVDAVTLADANKFRDEQAERVSANTTNQSIMIARIIWRDAIREQVATDNPFGQVRRLKSDSATRRAFTLDELKRLLAVSSGDWRGMILCGVYLGQRLADLASLTWANVDLAQGEVSIVTGKTERPMHIPMAEPLRRYFMERPAADDPAGPVFPDLHGLKPNALSNQFNAIAASVGLARVGPGQKRKGKSNDARRSSRGMSFHCLRHTATSLLKNAGVSDVVARELIGHSSEAVSRVYTHIEGSTMRAAVGLLPDVTKGEVKP